MSKSGLFQNIHVYCMQRLAHLCVRNADYYNVQLSHSLRTGEYSSLVMTVRRALFFYSRRDLWPYVVT